MSAIIACSSWSVYPAAHDHPVNAKEGATTAGVCFDCVKCCATSIDSITRRNMTSWSKAVYIVVKSWVAIPFAKIVCWWERTVRTKDMTLSILQKVHTPVLWD